VHQIVADADLDAVIAALGELRAAGWPAPEDPDSDEDAPLTYPNRLNVRSGSDVGTAAYTERWTPGNPWQGCERFICMFGALGYLTGSSPEHAYALLDVISGDGDILATYDIPHASAFRFIYRKLNLRIAQADGAMARSSCEQGHR